MEERVRFEVLYSRCAPVVRAYLQRRAGTADVEDLLAEVFLVCWRRFHELPVEPLPWLIVVARRTLSTSRRGERRRAALTARLASADPSVHHDFEGRALETALSAMSEVDRELVLLIAWEGLTIAEAASILGIRTPTARVRLHRARKRLATALDGQRPSACPTASPAEASS